jgi:hypothetical protein
MPPGSVCITSLLDMAINLQLIMKNHPVIRIRISKAKIVKPNVRLIMIESKSPKQIFMSDHIGNDLVCVITTHYFFVCFTLVLSCLYFLCEWNYFGLDLPTPGYYCKKTSYSYSYAYQRHLLCSCRLL